MILSNLLSSRWNYPIISSVDGGSTSRLSLSSSLFRHLLAVVITTTKSSRPLALSLSTAGTSQVSDIPLLAVATIDKSRKVILEGSIQISYPTQQRTLGTCQHKADKNAMSPQFVRYHVIFLFTTNRVTFLCLDTIPIAERHTSHMIDLKSVTWGWCYRVLARNIPVSCPSLKRVFATDDNSSQFCSPCTSKDDSYN